MLHSDIQLTDNHTPYAFTYADAAARGGDTSRSSSDVGKFARQLDDNSIWMLTSTAPTWTRVSPAAPTPVVNTFTYTINGALAVNTGTLRKYPDRDITITGVYFSIGVVGTGTVEVDVKKNGTSIFTVPLTITAGQYKSLTNTVSVPAGSADYITVDVIQSGAAADAVVTVVYQ